MIRKLQITIKPLKIHQIWVKTFLKIDSKTINNVILTKELFNISTEWRWNRKQQAAAEEPNQIFTAAGPELQPNSTIFKPKANNSFSTDVFFPGRLLPSLSRACCEIWSEFEISPMWRKRSHFKTCPKRAKWSTDTFQMKDQQLSWMYLEKNGA